jgi:hypothetical protein
MVSTTRLFLLTIALPLHLTGCLEDQGQKVASVSDAVILSGMTVDAAGEPVEGVNVTAEREAETLAMSGPDGRFEIVLPRSRIRGITSTLSSERKTFFLYFEQVERNFFTASEPISLDDIGARSLGLVVMAAPGGVSGKALRADAGQIISPAAGSAIHVGPVSAVVAEDGSFHFTRAPSGRVPMTITASGARVFYAEYQILAGQTRALEDPCISFSGVGPLGVIVEKPGRPLAELVESGHPTSKHFRVHAAEETRFVRVHHELAKLEALEAQEASRQSLGLQDPKPTTPADTGKAGVSATDIPWFPVTSDLDYDFPANGGHVLYYQFTDFTKTKRSKIYQVGVDVDVFADSEGFFGLGSSPFGSSRMRLGVDVPVAAVSMRFAEDPKDLASLPWSPIAAELSYDFHPRDADPTRGGEPILRKLYGQFRDAYGHDSGIFVSLFELRLFPGLSLVVGDGSGLVTEQVVPVQLNVPPEALFMRSAESPEGLKEAVWQAAAPAAEFRFSPTLDPKTNSYSIAGQRQVCYQLKDVNAFISQAVCENVVVDLFAPSASYGFRINGGAPVSTSLMVDLEIAVPPNASEMRIFESASDGTTTITSTGTASIYTAGGGRNTVAEREWLPAMDRAFFTFGTAGSKTLLVQFKMAGDLVSTSYAQPITILPLEESYIATDFLINGGAPLAVDPTLSIDILNVPGSAVAMAVSTVATAVVTAGLATTPVIDPGSEQSQIGLWQPLSDHSELNVRGKGPKTVLVQFRNSDGQLSPVFKRTIDYDPFPAELVRVEVDGGASKTYDGKVQVEVTAPATAWGMRVSTSLSGIATEPYQPFQNSFDLTLPAATGDYRVYIQLKADNGDESLIFSSSPIRFETFPVAELEVVLDGAPATVASRSVQLSISAPEPSALMRISTSLAGLPGEAWVAFQSDASFTLPATPGAYKVYVQVRSTDGTESIPFVSADAITYDPFPADLVRVVANGGVAMTTDPNLPLEMTLTAPAAATQMRIASTPTALATASWSSFQASTTLVLPNVDGAYKAYVQLKNADGIESIVFESGEVTLDVP